MALTAVALIGCDSLLDGFDAGVTPPPPDMMIVNEFVAGEWQITGTGLFDPCDSPFSEAEFELRSTVFTVEQAPSGRLTLVGQPDPGGLRFEDGRIIGSEVGFVTEEDTDRGPIRLEYAGELDALSNVRGRFEGIGPDACLSAGRFTVRIDLAERPPEPDMALPDAAVDGDLVDLGAPDAGTDGAAEPDGATDAAADAAMDGAAPDAG